MKTKASLLIFCLMLCVQFAKAQVYIAIDGAEKLEPITAENNFTYGRTTGIANHPEEGQYRVTGNFNGSAKLFDNTQLNSPFNTGHIFVTKLIDNGSSSIFKQDTTGANNVFNDTSLWVVFPNPAQDYVQIEPSSKESYTYEFRNALGQIVSTKENLSGTHVINVGGLARGLYLLKVSSGTKSEMIKVILTH